MLHYIAMSLYLAGDTLLLAFALQYLLRPTVMPYHLVAMGKRWEEIEQPTRTILLALMRAAGAACLALSVVVACLVFGGLSQRLAWANCTLLLVLMVYLVPVTFVMVKVRRSTSGRPPILASIMGILITLVAFACQGLAGETAPRKQHPQGNCAPALAKPGCVG
jgi:hypothetical protein